MKKRFITLGLIIVAAIVCVALIMGRDTASRNSLSKEEISRLRAEYPVNDKRPSNVELLEQSFEEIIQHCDSFVEVEIVSEPVEYVKTISIDPDSPEGAVHDKAGGRTEFTFVKYNVRIINDIFDSIQQETVEITYNIDFDVSMPDMEIGSKFIIGGVYNTKYDTLDIGHHTIFYVTEEEYVLSLQSESSRSSHDGARVEEIVEYIKSVKSGKK